MPAAGIPIPFTIVIGSLPEGIGFDPQAIVNSLEEILQISLNEGVAFFTIGATAPTSNIGPWLKDGTTWYVWSDAVAGYVPATIPQGSLRYIVSATKPPALAGYQIWFQTDSSGRPIFTWVFNSGNNKWQAIQTSVVGDLKDFNGTASQITTLQNPLGWFLADGSVVNGHTTQDMRTYFSQGATMDSQIGVAGGQSSIAGHTHTLPSTTDNYTLQIADMPNHYHNFTTNYYVKTGYDAAAGSVRVICYDNPGTPDITLVSVGGNGGGGAHQHTITGPTGTAGAIADFRPLTKTLYKLEYCGIPDIAA